MDMELLNAISEMMAKNNDILRQEINGLRQEIQQNNDGLRQEMQEMIDKNSKVLMNQFTKERIEKLESSVKRNEQEIELLKKAN